VILASSLVSGGQMVLGVLLAAGGIFVLWLLRGGRHLPIHLSGIGSISAVTQTVLGLALLGVGYHVFVHAAGLTQFRAPLPIAIGVAALAIIGSIAVDAVENRPRPGDRDDDPQDPMDRSGR
jgi:hypothetical protein